MNAFATAGRRLMVEDFDASPSPPPARPVTPFCPCPRCGTEGRAAACPSASFDDGIAQGRRERAVEIAQTAEGLSLALEDALERSANAAQEAAARDAEALAGLVIAALMSALPASLAHLGAAEARAIVAAVLPSLASEPAISIAATPYSIGAISAAIGALPLTSRERIDLHAAASGEPELVVTWSAGRLRRSHADALAAVEDTLAQFGLAPPGPVPAGEAPSQARYLETTTHG